ncbi:toll/interleukin-1 receptor domain-containing protein [Saccharicrinis sp. 156]|uniref:toll/interleukin-1 receptor domain-containing protein n=1 Tax=Saccharicrinis sp. 156 TaxID=3417574 RepID=UPI003D359AF8
MKIFLSYRRDDSSDITGRIYDRLVQHFGDGNIFKDVDSIPLGADFRDHLDSAVSKCHFFLAIVGPDWLYARDDDSTSYLNNPSDFVRIELESALKRDIPVIPILVRKATMPLGNTLPESLKPFIYRNGISIRPDPDFHNDMDRLMRAIEHHLPKNNL